MQSSTESASVHDVDGRCVERLLEVGYLQYMVLAQNLAGNRKPHSIACLTQRRSMHYSSKKRGVAQLSGGHRSGR
jgi:hypothetical protein